MTIKGAAYVGSVWAALFLAVGYGLWQTKTKKTTAPQAPTATQSQPTDLEPESTPFTFPNPWPAPLARPEGSVDEVAEILAQKVLAGGSDALPALERAALESGFAIHGEHGEVLYKPEDSNSVGVSMLDFDLAAAAESTRHKQKTRMADLQKIASKNSSLKGISLKDLFSSTVADYGDEGDEIPNKRFWGQFVQALGSESEGQFDDGTTASDDIRLCGAQVTWLLYMASGQAAAATSSDSVQPAQTSPAENPPTAEDPPPHGPSAQQQQRTGGDVITNLVDVVQLSSRPDFHDIFQAAQSRGGRLTLAFIELCRERAMLLGLRVKGKRVIDRLVRTKKFGETGGSTTFEVIAYLEIDDEIRRRYQEAVAVFPEAISLPEDGPLEGAEYTVVPPDECDLDPTTQTHEFVFQGRRTYAMQVFKLTAKRQERQLSQNPVPDDYSRQVDVQVDTPFGSTVDALDLPIRDWLPRGVVVIIDGKVSGHGTLKRSEGTKLKWSIDRTIIGGINLSTFSPIPYIHSASTGASRYTSWTQYAGNADYVPEDWFCRVNDRYKTILPADGCGHKRGATTTSTITDKDRPRDQGEAWQTQFNTGFAEFDKRDNTVSIKVPLPKIPVVTNPSDFKDMVDPFVYLDLDSSPSPVVEGSLQFMGMSSGTTTESFQVDHRFHYNAKYNAPGTGGRHVDIDFYVVVKFVPPSSPTTNEVMAVLDRAKTSAKSVVSSMLAQSFSRPQLRSDDRMPVGHGPLWVSDASAATCSEIEIDDELPPSARQHK